MRRTIVLKAILLTLSGAFYPGSSAAARSPAPIPPGAGDSQITQISARLSSGKTSCVSVIEARLDRIRRLDGSLHAVTAISPIALDEAQRIDALPRRARRALPLACVPLLVKDNIDVAGMVTTSGSVALAGNVASDNAWVVARLKRAGAIVVAKTNMSEFAFNYRGRSSIRGQTTSPFAFSESAGGSSSGNAAALAAGFGAIALGTDTSGSARVPAALSGLVGLRPTFGALPMGGVLPLSPSQDVIGPMCTHVADCAAVWSVLTSTHDTPAGRPLKNLRVGVLSAFMRPDAKAETQALERLRAAGATVADIHLRDETVLVGKNAPIGETATFASRSVFDFPGVMDAYLPWRAGVPHDAGALLAELRHQAANGNTDPRVVEDVAKFITNRAGAARDPRFRVNGMFRDRYVADRLDEAFDCTSGRACVDVIVYPSVQVPFATADAGPETAGTHRLAAYSGRPAIAIPIGAVLTTGGLRPVSLELLGRRGDDRRLLAIAAAWQARLALPRIIPCESAKALVCLTDPAPNARRH
ncbi:amidase [Novosphingobium sp. ERN07]|uniref:amidase n=1 Tax=Novosphingobium sp. ERN07 TaxID=2726187 RepID=UPI0014566270|nr:amidase [Novosphingobium sp. ERN07]NLR70298.1 amidase [Novosphingobium sp. ERN07]